MAKNLILIGGIFHPFEEASEALADCLSGAGITSMITSDIEGGLAQLAAGDQFDLLTIYALRWRMTQHEKYVPYRDEWAFSLSPEGRAAIRSHVENGGGLLALHTASICFDDWPEWGHVLGGAWDWSRSFHPDLGLIRVNIASQNHPVTAGLGDFEVEDEIYHHLALRPGIEPLLSAEASREDGPQTIMWARDLDEGRVVYDALAHDAASSPNATHGRLLRRAALWALGRSDADIEAV